MNSEQWFKGVCRLLFIAVMACYLYACPFTKVEESFNMQAMHDLLFLGRRFDEYDHLEFPGVVPRSFIGASTIASFSMPFVRFYEHLDNFDKFTCQYIVRFTLGLFISFAMFQYVDAVSQLFNGSVALWTLLITITQFHFMFYCSRSLPNTFALFFVLLAYKHWILGRHGNFIALAAFATVVFRGELVLLFGPMVLVSLLYDRLSIWKAILFAVASGILSIIATVGFDSLFWRRLLWPEGEVLWYNVVLNKSGNWGKMPFLWYFYSALPRGLGISAILVPIAMYTDTKVSKLLVPILAFIGMYSFLPHKELRFIIYSVPVFNTAIAVVCQRWSIGAAVGKLGFIKSVFAHQHLMLNLLGATVFLFASQNNYSGGEALMYLNNLKTDTPFVNVHIDVAAAQTGVTRFLHVHQAWSYNKTEDLSDADKLNFTHLLVGIDSVVELKRYFYTHDVVTVVEGFHRVAFNWKSFPPFTILKEPKIAILARKPDLTVVTSANPMHRSLNI